MTNKIMLKTPEEFMRDYVPVYQPIYPLFLGNSVAYAEKAEKLALKRTVAMGDIRAKHITPKDTELHQINVKEGSKTFKKYFMMNQFINSSFQGSDDIEDVSKQVLDENQKLMDDLFLLGEGTSDSTMINNGLFWSADPNYVLESSATVDGDGVDPLIDLHAKVMTNALEADQVAGRKVIIFYGSTILPYFDGVYAATSTPFKKVLQEVLGSNYSLFRLPSDVTPSNANGWIIANLDQCKLHYTALPQLKSQGVNDEKMYSWHNFLLGSCMLDVKALGGVIRQPATVDLGA